MNSPTTAMTIFASMVPLFASIVMISAWKFDFVNLTMCFLAPVITWVTMKLIIDDDKPKRHLNGDVK